MEQTLQLATTRDFNGITLNCYREDAESYLQDFWATREQIGQALGYKNPNDAIRFIHRRNKKRLDQFSQVVKLSAPKKGGCKMNPPSENLQDTVLYNFKGLLEICRYSQQPNAHKVIDVLWDIADEIRRTGMYVSSQVVRRLEERVSELERQTEAEYPVKLLGSIVLARPESITFQSAAQFLAQHGIATGQNRLYKKCREKGILCKRKGRQWNKPSQRAIEQGLLDLEASGGFRPIAMVTPKGLQYLAEMFVAEKYPLLMLMDGEGETEQK